MQHRVVRSTTVSFLCREMCRISPRIKHARRFLVIGNQQFVSLKNEESLLVQIRYFHALVAAAAYLEVQLLIFLIRMHDGDDR